MTQDPRWYCLVTTPQKEKEAVYILTREGHEAVRAIEMKLGRTGGRVKTRKWVAINITPRYIFYKTAGWPNMYWLTNLYGRDGLRIISGFLAHYGNERFPASLPDDVVEALRVADTTGLENLHKSFKEGDLVKLGGPAFEGAIGTLIRVRKETATMLIEMLGTMKEVQVDVAKLEAA